MENIYDRVPYPSLSYAASHPSHLAALATVLGMKPAPVNRCRVLEVGCASGGNLIPMAYALPDSQFVGIDYAVRQIEAGQARVAGLHLANLSLLAADIRQIDETLGEFDYIIAHGVYSWTPPPVRDALLGLCTRHLALDGITFISYNTYPGWHMTGIMRDAMLFHTRDLPDPLDRARRGREFVHFLADSIPSEKSAYAHFFKSYVEMLGRDIKGANDAFILHDEMEETNDPVYFYQFMQHAGRHRLQYVADAEFRTVFPFDIAQETLAQLQTYAGDTVELEQYLDFLRNRMFRQTLLCHQRTPVDRLLDPSRIVGLYISSQARAVSEQPDLRTVSVEQFKSADGGTLTTDHPVSKMALTILREQWPRAIAFETLLSQARSRLGGRARTERAAKGSAKQAAAEHEELSRDRAALADNLLHAFAYSTQLVKLSAFAPRFSTSVGRRPIASPVARVQVQDGAVVTNLWHDRVRLTDVQRVLLPLLDGSRDRASLLAQLEARVAPGNASSAPALRDALATDLELHLRYFAEFSLLIG